METAFFVITLKHALHELYKYINRLLLLIYISNINRIVFPNIRGNIGKEALATFAQSTSLFT